MRVKDPVALSPDEKVAKEIVGEVSIYCDGKK
jgi:hypothetical protein